jgi:restriction system protein
MRRMAAALAGLLGLAFLGAGLLQAANGIPAELTLGGGLLVLVMALGLALLPGGTPSRPDQMPGRGLPPAGAEAPPAALEAPLDPADLDARLLAAIKGLSPAQFENFCGLLLERMGYAQVRVQGKAGDGGIDLTMYHGDTLVIAQCKRYQSNVGAPALREFYGTLVHSGAAHGFFITTSDFTPPARDWVRGKPITLINGPRLIAVVRRYLLAEMLQQ